jgi:BASS family bile acid:Na+ symporter
MILDSGGIVRVLTITTLAGLLFSSGLRLTWAEVSKSIHQCRLGWLLVLNFLIVPALTFMLARFFKVTNEAAAGMVLLAAAPFAPVVPTFTRLAKGNLALAAGLTGLFPVISSFLTPLICGITLRPILATGSSLNFHVGSILLVLMSTITLPLAAGIALRHWKPSLAGGLLKPIQVVSEGTGAAALALVVFVEFHTITKTSWNELLAMFITSELSFVLGYLLCGLTTSTRLVAALGTANRNIALALLIAAQTFPQSTIQAAVVTNGLLMILFGLVHIGIWRFIVSRRRSDSTSRS